VIRPTAVRINPVPIMRHRLSALASLPRVSTLPSTRCAPLFTRTPPSISLRYGAPLQLRSYARKPGQSEAEKFGDYSNSNARPATKLNEKITQEEKDHFAVKLREDRGKQIRTPWHREGSDTPPVARQRSAGAMTKGMFTSHLLQAQQLTICRQTANYALSHAQNHPPAYDERPKHRP
jgi:hypothetical protein